MDSSRSHPSYSDDFEQDIESPQNSPRSEDKVEIKVFKSPIGSLTVHPKKLVKNVPPVKNSPPPPPPAAHPPPNKRAGKTLSELSVLSHRTKTPESGRSGGGPTNPTGNANNNATMNKVQKVKSVSTIKAATSKSSIGGRVNVMRNKALAQEKIDPHDVPASIAPSASSLSLAKLNMQRNLSGGGTAGAIRRVLAHTAIKEKSYASAKYKTYNAPGVLKGASISYNRSPTVRGGFAKANYVSQRVASAKRMTIMDLKSKIKLLEDEIEKLKKENRFLNHLHHRQDNALRRWEGKDAELPRLLNQHKDEIRSLQEQLRRAQNSAREVNEKMSLRDKKILRMETELEKLRALVHEEHLEDRHTLQEELDITRMNLAGAEKRIREYMRHVDILEKNHRHQLAAEERKLIKVNTHTYELQQVVANLKLALRNKDRMLNYIQMRSSGRNLIRAFHAQRDERGPEDIIYGPSLISDLSRSSYHAPLQKSRSFDFGNSRCNTPYLEDHNREKFIDYVPSKRNSFEEKRKLTIERDSRKKLFGKEQKSASGEVAKRSQSLESRASNSPNSKKAGKSRKSRSIVHSPSSHGKIDNTGKNEGNKKEKGIKSILKNSEKEIANRNKRKEKEINSQKNAGREHKQISKTSRITSKKDGKAMGDKSKELIYEGSSVGFKYEGPFVKSQKQDSTEILYTASTGNLSQPSLTEGSSSCSTKSDTSNSLSQTQSARSSHSEIISNIDILSARIRESCIKVSPPEKMLSSRSRSEEEETKTVTAQTTPRGDVTQNQTGKSYPELGISNNPPQVGPGGDNANNQMASAQAHLLAAPILLNTATVPVMSMSNPEQSFQGYVQPIQLISGEMQEITSPKSHGGYMGSPRIQQFAINLPSIPTQYQTTDNLQSAQITEYVQNSDSSRSQMITQGQSNDIQEQQQQILQGTPINYNYSQNYPTTYSLVTTTDPQPSSVLSAFHQETQQSAQQLQEQNSLRYPMDFQYFSFAPTLGQDMQTSLAQTNSTNVTLIQTSSPYDSPLSSRSTGYGQGNTYYAPSTSSSPQLQQQQSSFPRIGGTFYGSKQTSNATPGNNVDQSSNSPKKSNQQTSGYNPSYYANLGSWK